MRDETLMNRQVSSGRATNKPHQLLPKKSANSMTCNYKVFFRAIIKLRNLPAPYEF